MRIFPQEPAIGDRDGFLPALDIFGRSEIGASLTNLLSVVQDPIVLALDAEWGAGKTVFLKMWAGELRKLGVPVIFLDAFANDYSDDAFAVLAGEIVALAKEKKLAKNPAAKEFAKQAVRTGKVLIKGAVGALAKHLTMGVFEAADLKEFGSDAASVAAAASDSYIEKIIKNADEQKATFEAFRAALSELPALLGAPEASEKKPLVIIIDELDRCNPIFALSVLERMKHFFSVPNVHFVLGVHLGQLRNSVLYKYGPGIDAQTYLQKFIHLTVPFVDTARHDDQRTAHRYIHHLVSNVQAPNDKQRALQEFGEMLSEYERVTPLTLRQIERVFTIFGSALASIRRRSDTQAPLLAGLCILKVLRPELYLRAKLGKLTYDEVEKALNFDAMHPTLGQRTTSFIAKWWSYATGEPLDASTLQECQQAIGYGDRSELLPRITNSVIDRFEVFKNPAT